MNAERWNRQMVAARRDAALCAYETALDWFTRYPAHEVERRLVEIITAKRQAAQVSTSPKSEAP